MAGASRTQRRWPLILVATMALVLLCVGLFVAWTHGAFESRLKYWSDRGQLCGDVDHLPNGQLADWAAAEQAITCFVTDYAQCRPAVLALNQGGTDTAENETFVVEPRANHQGCDLGMRYSAGIVGSGRATKRETQCAGLTDTDGALTISDCQGFGDYTMP